MLSKQLRLAAMLLLDELYIAVGVAMVSQVEEHIHLKGITQLIPTVSLLSSSHLLCRNPGSSPLSPWSGTTTLFSAKPVRLCFPVCSASMLFIGEWKGWFDLHKNTICILI